MSFFFFSFLSSFFKFISSDEKRASSALGFWPITWHISSSSFASTTPVMLFLRATIPTYANPPLCQPTWVYGVQVAWPWFISSFNRPAEVDLHSLFLLLTVSLWGLLIQTQKGRGNLLFLSTQWETTWQYQEQFN